MWVRTQSFSSQRTEGQRLRFGRFCFHFSQMCNGRHCVHPSQSAAIDLTGDEGIQRLNSSVRWGLQAEMAADPVVLGMHADEARVFFVS